MGISTISVTRYCLLAALNDAFRDRPWDRVVLLAGDDQQPARAQGSRTVDLPFGPD